jgi:hypothetical protein
VVTAAGRTQGPVATQGVVLDTADLLDTLTTEAVVHHLDLTAHLPEAAPPPAPAVAVTLATLRGIAGAGLPASWTAAEAIRKSTGRTPLTADDRRALGAVAGRMPLLA